MIKTTPDELSTNEMLQNFLDELKGVCGPQEFGDRLAEESVEKYFPKW